MNIWPILNFFVPATMKLGLGGGSAPKTPDYEAAARATAQGNLDLAKYATQANRANQITPWGSLTWTNDRTFNQAGYDAAMKAYNEGLSGGGGSNQGQWVRRGNGGDEGSWLEWVPTNTSAAGGRSGGSSMKPPDPNDFYTGGDQWTQTQSLSPEVQALFDRAMSGLNSDPSASGLTAYDPNLATNNATELIMQRLNPELDRQGEALRTRLANQGVTEGSEAWNRAFSNFGQQRNDAATQAALQGIGLGMQQQAQTFQNNAYLRGLPLNELNAVLSGGQLNFPSYAQQATTGGPDLMGAANAGYQAQLGASNAQNAQQSGMFGGLLGLGQLGLAGYGAGLFGGGGLAAGLGLLSDRRVKRNVRRIGTAGNGLGIYAYQYIWGGPEQIGYMADEVEKVSPEAVRDFGGLKVVDYGRV